MLTKNQQKGDTFTVFMLFLIGLIVVALLVAIFTFQIGYSSGVKSTESENDFMINGQLVTAGSLESIEQQNKQFKNEADVAKQERDISLKNLELLRAKVSELETNNLQLQRTIELFSTSIAKQGGIPLQVVEAKIEPLPENAFEYRFDVAMVNENGEYTQLVPKLTLLNNTSFVNIPLSPSTYDIKGMSYIRGRFVMPEGFKPAQLKLSLSAGDQTKEQIYNWRLGKKKADMPMSLSQVPDVDKHPITPTEKN
ncbi:MAG: hypothetical protein CSA42_00685 [Gammaproteobacteria bacterium]|nr:MAG: hypothetical protein CSA42_00685 [Gammaproteobacteria bacterium]